jgi:hypothetical protein
VMKSLIIVVCLFAMVFVMVAPAFAGGPGGQGNSQGTVSRWVGKAQTAVKSVSHSFQPLRSGASKPLQGVYNGVISAMKASPTCNNCQGHQGK